MHRRFIALIVGAAIAVTALSAAPARADSDDIARFIAGIAALAIIGAAIEDARDDPAPVVRRQVNPRHYSVAPRPVPPRVSRKVLPGECLRNVRTRDGEARVFTQRCLNNNYRHASQLPRACARQFRTDRGVRWGYRPRCLRDRGYTIALR